MTAKKKKTNSEGSSKKVNGAKKGKSWEREIANAIGHIFPEAKRHLEYQASAAAKGIDLEGTGCFKIQAKNYQGYAPIGKIFEIKELCEGDIPLLITKGNRLPPMVVLPFESMIYLMKFYMGWHHRNRHLKRHLKLLKQGTGYVTASEVLKNYDKLGKMIQKAQMSDHLTIVEIILKIVEKCEKLPYHRQLILTQSEMDRL